jgi:hypothetical protein
MGIWVEVPDEAVCDVLDRLRLDAHELAGAAAAAVEGGDLERARPLVARLRLLLSRRQVLSAARQAGRSVLVRVGRA